MKLNQLLRQAARITAGIDPNTKQAEEDHKGDAAYATALAGEKTASTKKADADPNTKQAEDDHKGDAAYETALKEASTKKADADPNTKQAEDDHKGDAAYETALKEASTKKADSEAPNTSTAKEDHAEDPSNSSEVVSEDPDDACEGCGGEECDSEECEGITNADMVETLEDIKQGIEDAKVELGDSPAAGVLEALEEVIEALNVTQDAVSEDAILDPLAQDTFKTASAFKAYFIKSRNIKAAKVISAELARHQASMQASPAPAPKKASVAPARRSFNPKDLK